MKARMAVDKEPRLATLISVRDFLKASVLLSWGQNLILHV
jgi:hypothetical protein